MESNPRSARSAAALHTVWHRDDGERGVDGPRRCPRCGDRTLDRKWFSNLQKVEIDQCASCGGIWLDDGEFSAIYAEIKELSASSPNWAAAMTSVRANAPRHDDGSARE